MRLLAEMVGLMIFAIYGALVVSSTTRSVAIIAADLQDNPVITPESRIILIDSVLRTHCLVGAFFGACLAAWIWKIETTDKMWRAVGLKILASWVAGVIFTPGLCRYFNMVEENYVVGLSGLISFLSIAVLAKAGPVLVVGVMDLLQVAIATLGEWIKGRK